MLREPNSPMFLTTHFGDVETFMTPPVDVSPAEVKVSPVPQEPLVQQLGGVAAREALGQNERGTDIALVRDPGSSSRIFLTTPGQNQRTREKSQGLCQATLYFGPRR